MEIYGKRGVALAKGMMRKRDTWNETDILGVTSQLVESADTR